MTGATNAHISMAYNVEPLWHVALKTLGLPSHWCLKSNTGKQFWNWLFYTELQELNSRPVPESNATGTSVKQEP